MDEENKEASALLQEVEKGLRFLHTLGMQSKVDIVDLNKHVLALIETLISSGHLDLRSFEERCERVAEREAERMNREGHARVMVNDVQDKYLLSDLPQIDCKARLHLCKARCCKLGFTLSFQDLDERVVKWDYGNPYYIRHGADGYCVHSAPDSRTCLIYGHRPAVCRTYDCRHDDRIWKDFDRGIPADHEP